MDLTAFAAAVGTDGDVTIAGLSTRSGALDGVRTVGAPSGIDWYKSDEMTISVGAGTPMSTLLDALHERGQQVALPHGGTVGGALAVGESSIYRLGHGPTRDSLLKARFVTADGTVASAGGAVVKNVSGFDVCRLLVGSHGTLGFLGEVVLRTRPAAALRQWYITDEPPASLRPRLYRPSAVLWDGMRVWVCLEGHRDDLVRQATALGLRPTDGPPILPAHRWSLPLAQAATFPSLGVEGAFVAELGVGVVHTSQPQPARATQPAVVDVHRRLKTLYDPRGRLNPGRMPFGLDAPVAAH
jgi:glycolate oxidase FAD binding subunit